MFQKTVRTSHDTLRSVAPVMTLQLVSQALRRRAAEGATKSSIICLLEKNYFFTYIVQEKLFSVQTLYRSSIK